LWFVDVGLAWWRVWWRRRVPSTAPSTDGHSSSTDGHNLSMKAKVVTPHRRSSSTLCGWTPARRGMMTWRRAEAPRRTSRVGSDALCPDPEPRCIFPREVVPWRSEPLWTDGVVRGGATASWSTLLLHDRVASKAPVACAPLSSRAPPRSSRLQGLGCPLPRSHLPCLMSLLGVRPPAGLGVP
jgi:hypothetical protein